jgi:hypothetical protein
MVVVVHIRPHTAFRGEKRSGCAPSIPNVSCLKSRCKTNQRADLTLDSQIEAVYPGGGEASEGEPMDEEREWLTSTDAWSMLDILQGKVSNRKMRLFACTMCRQIWDYLADQRLWNAVEIAERYADGLSREEELQAATADALALHQEASAAIEATEEKMDSEADQRVMVADIVMSATTPIVDGSIAAYVAGPWDLPSDLLRDILGNPFRPITFDPAYRTPAVLALAQAAYNNRVLPAGTLEPDRLAVLADALEEAGCTIPDILGHLRGPGPHVRGCHVVDLLLCKE